MPLRNLRELAGRLPSTALLIIGVAACTGSAPRSEQDPDSGSSTTDGLAATRPLILAKEQGERRIARWGQGDELLIFKVDPRNGGSKDLVLGVANLPPGDAIPAHRHLVADEIIFVVRGSGIAEVGDQQASFGEEATLFIPRNTRVTLRNTGAEPLALVYVFSKPGFEEQLRDESVSEGEPVLPISPEENVRIREKHCWHTVYEPPLGLGRGGC